ncbi:MAG: rhomboid family intramembrane serine protease [Chlamydiota bacterium]
MRLVATFEQEKEAFEFSLFLKKQEIPSSYEPQADPSTGALRYLVWIVNEEDIEDALLWAEKFRQNPQDPLFIMQSPGFIPPSGSVDDLKIKVDDMPKFRSRLTLTNLLIVLCGLLFFWNAAEEAEIVQSQGLLALQMELTPIQQNLLFDYPQKNEEIHNFISSHSLKEYEDVDKLPSDIKAQIDQIDLIPYWQGVVDVIMNWHKTGWNYLRTVPLFEKIREGEVWRLFTPCLLHRDILHILFNMAWLFVLGRQIEERLKKTRMIMLMLIIGIISNIVQYFMGGPYFLGFSGVVVGMVGYIWMRERLAPWEGYPLQRSVIIFVIIFVAAMFGLEVISWLLQLFKVTNQSPAIANTAHIVGGLVGMWLGRLSAFAQRKVV